LGGGGEQEGDEVRGLLPVAAVVAEQLLELVDQDEEAGALGQRLDAEAPVERHAAAAEVFFQGGDGGVPLLLGLGRGGLGGFGGCALLIHPT